VEGFDTDTGDSETIFVSVASFRDIECNDTINQLFTKAKFPERVFIGACEQNKTEDESCTSNPMMDEEFIRKHVRKTTIHFSDATGPTKARFLCSQLYNNETYFMQIDSHSDFISEWDVELIRMIKNLKKKGVNKPVLSNYPASRDDNKETPIDEVPVLCESSFNDNGILTFKSVLLKPRPEGYPVPFCSGGLIFSEGSILKDVPYDPELPYLFTGEEILYSARAWTNGYDIYTPDKNVIFHHYVRDDSPKVWNDVKTFNGRDAEAKVRAILKIPKDGDPKVEWNPTYGLGTKRTLEQYYEFAGIDPVTKTSKSKDKFC
jgi:hypothetical protein